VNRHLGSDRIGYERVHGGYGFGREIIWENDYWSLHRRMSYEYSL